MNDMQIEDIPYDYALCYATDEQCGRASHCLRRQAARLNEEQEKPRSVAYCVTPTYVTRVSTGTPCEHFRPDTPLRYARGMSHLFDAVPRSIYSQVRKRVMQVFSCERIFYYAQKGEYLTSPDEQKRILSIFAQTGLPEPSFDAYEMRPNWEA